MRERFPALSGSKWLWNTVNESDLAGNHRVGGCQVRPGSLGMCECACLPVCALCIYLFDSSSQQSK